MVNATERDRELVADLAAERRCLGKAQMMGIGGTAAADQARLLGYRFDVVAITNPPGCR
jgi:glycerol dehydrogenase-like iron-containing ADH family enzyme